MFSVFLGGFDTHADQLATQADLFAKLSQAMSAFYEATRELGVSGRVTTYTDTEFNRTMAPNRTHGTDHAWGGHHLVMGGSIRGGDIHGQMPSLELNGRDDAGMRGVWIPTTSAHDYQSRFAQRFGLPGATSSLVV